MGTELWKHRGFRSGWKTFEGVVRRKLQSFARRTNGESWEYEWDRFVREALAQLERHRASGYTWDCFETFRTVVVRVSLPPNQERMLPKLIVDGRRLTISGIPGKLDETIDLPAPVATRKPRAVYANGILEVRLRKAAAVRTEKRLRCIVRKSPSGS